MFLAAELLLEYKTRPKKKLKIFCGIIPLSGIVPDGEV